MCEDEVVDAREACGVFGVYAPDQPVAHLTYAGLHALQHRGQESAGMAVSDGEDIYVLKDMGLVTNVFNERNMAPLEGHLAIGTLLAFIATAAYAILAGPEMRNSAGWILFVLLMSLLLVNLYTTGRKAYAKRTGL